MTRSLFLTRRSLLTAGAWSAGGIAAPALARIASQNTASLDQFLAEQMHDARMPGLAVGVARAGVVLAAKGYGFADLARRRRVTAHSMFHIASVTKTVTATGIMMLVADGRIALDDAVNNYLDFNVINPAAPHTPITVQHLLLHTSSISDETYYNVDFRVEGRDTSLGLRDFLRDYLVPDGAHYSAERSFHARAPGLAFDYSNVGYGLLGYLGERVAGRDFRKFLHTRLFDRLGMNGVSWTLAGVPPHLSVTPYDMTDNGPTPVKPVAFPDWPAGMLRASVAAIMPFVAATANGGATGNARMLNQNSTAQMLDMRVLADLPPWITRQGLDWTESIDNGHSLVNHWGGDPGVFTACYIDPPTTTGVAIFTNATATDASKAAVKAIARRLLKFGEGSS